MRRIITKATLAYVQRCHLYYSRVVLIIVIIRLVEMSAVLRHASLRQRRSLPSFSLSYQHFKRQALVPLDPKAPLVLRGRWVFRVFLAPRDPWVFRVLLVPQEHLPSTELWAPRVLLGHLVLLDPPAPPPRFI